ncbi:hypothetical protein [Alistipes shahii]|uniref:hypothetical protein n=1 Tax=Alistipes shahii TaxID=328814 RepID=UPI0018A0315C|nr:hypothetical protein [Alistipes shahii]
MADLQKYKKNEKNKEKSAKHRACVIMWLVTNVLSGEKNSAANCGERVLPPPAGGVPWNMPLSFFLRSSFFIVFLLRFEIIRLILKTKTPTP